MRHPRSGVSLLPPLLAWGLVALLLPTTGPATEVGGNDTRLSDMGPDGVPEYDAHDPAVAYNVRDDEYLVVWWGGDETPDEEPLEYEIFGQRLDAATGQELGENDFRISDMGPDGAREFGAFQPDVAYSPAAREYLVVWEGNDLLESGDFEIYGQRIDAATGVEAGDNDFRISDMGEDLDDRFEARSPAVAYSLGPREYLVVWEGDDGTAPLAIGEFEIYGQRIDALSGLEMGENDFRISDMGPPGDRDFDAEGPRVVYNSLDDEYLVTWVASNVVPEEKETYLQRLEAATGEELGIDDERISDMGPDGDGRYRAADAAAAFSRSAGSYLVVWEGDDDQDTLVEGELEVFGQRIEDVYLLDGPGDCPGEGVLSLAGATPGAAQRVLMAGDLGSDPVGSGPCGEVETGLEEPSLLGVLEADEHGRATLEMVSGGAMCGDYLQAVDTGACRVSGLDALGPLDDCTLGFLPGVCPDSGPRCGAAFSGGACVPAVPPQCSVSGVFAYSLEAGEVVEVELAGDLLSLEVFFASAGDDAGVMRFYDGDGVELPERLSTNGDCSFASPPLQSLDLSRAVRLIRIRAGAGAPVFLDDLRLNPE